jgi:hypothetical protein
MARPRNAFLLVLLLTLTPLVPLAAASGAGGVPVSAAGPDADGVWLLSYDVTRAAAGAVAVALDVVRDDGDTVARATRDLGARELPAGTSRLDVSFVPFEGAGDYAVSLAVDGVAGDALLFTVADGDAASADLTFSVPDEPTYLNLTSDSVNGDLKLKSPGDAVVTRATLVDGNGWGDLSGVAWRVDRSVGGAWSAADAGPLAVNASASATSVPLEHRYDRSPIAAGTYRLTLAAQKAGTDVANASRTFVIREVAATLLGGSLTPATVVPDENATLAATLVVGDKNGINATSSIEARVYKGSSRAEGLGFAATLAGIGNLTTLAHASGMTDADGYGRAAFALAVHVPARAAAGAHRVSVYVDGALLASLPFDVAPLPTIAAVNATGDDGAWVLTVAGTGDGVLEAALRDAEGAESTTRASLVNGSAVVRLTPPSDATALEWTLALHARADGPALEQRSGWWNRTAISPVPVLVPERVGARLPAVWRVEADGWDLVGANVSVAFSRWDGAAERALSGSFDGERLRVDGPATLAPGRYTARATFRLDNGTEGVATWSFEAGPWLRLDVGAPVVAGREARVPVENVGGVAVHRFVVEVGGSPLLANATLTWEEGATTVALESRNGRKVASGVDLAPGESGSLVVRLPDGPLPAGALHAKVRLLALPGGAS